MQNFKNYVNEILKNHSGERIFGFEYGGQKYWLKQPEFRIRGGLLTKIFKRNPKKAFDYEAKKYEILCAAGLPVPRLVLRGQDYFVLQDAGEPLDAVLHNATDENKTALIAQYASALAGLHARSFTHGRPALRDILFKEGELKFIDFENDGEHGDPQELKTRDFLLFVYDLCREGLSESLVREGIRSYVANGGADIVQNAWAKVLRLRPLYLLLRLLPAKFKDLNAAIRTFELCLKIIKDGGEKS